MKEEYTILVPTMLPFHFRMVINILNAYGYKAELLENSGRGVTDKGLKYVHNDSCYPALLVIGQMIDALESGAYDPRKTALLISQTGGGCRASNYIFLLRKALERAGYGFVPVISFNVLGMERNPGFKLTLSMLHRMLYAVTYGDLIMALKNQCRPYELNPGDSDRLTEEWTRRLTDGMREVRVLSYRRIKQNYMDIIRGFASIPRRNERRAKVGVVGEIFVKYSPLGNNNLEDFLVSEGAEVVVPGLLDFCLYCVDGSIIENKLYGIKKIKAFFSRFAHNFLVKKQNDIIDMITREGTFDPPSSFQNAPKLAEEYIGLGAKMGEGWLLTAEMLELIKQGVNNIICTQPFGCLPNHIVGKGMMKPIKERHPDANIVAIDYDAGASAINQENRIKLMLANAQAALS